MRIRIVSAIFAVTAVALVLFAVPLAIAVGRLTDGQATLRLQSKAMLAARNIPSQFATRSDPVELPAGGEVHYRLYDAAGILVAGVGPSTADSFIRTALLNRIAIGEVGERLLVAVPVVEDEAVTGVLEVDQSTAGIDRGRQKALLLIAMLGLGAIAIATGQGWLIANNLARPIQALRHATEQLGTGDFAVSVPSSRIPELAATSVALASTAQRLEALINSERAFSADASHQLRTPLTSIRTTLETELDHPRKDPTVAIRETLGDIDRLERTIAELLDIARNTNRLASIELEPILAMLESNWSRRASAARRSLHVDRVLHIPTVIGHPTMLQHALDVLVDNALKHGGGAIRIAITADDFSVTITIHDEGPGFGSAGVAITSDLVRPDTAGRGLPLARRLMRAQNGRLIVSPPPGGHVSVSLGLDQRNVIG